MKMNIKILIVEDEFIVANALRLAVAQAGYQVTDIAASFEEADECLKKETPDLVLLDIRLAGKKSGIDLARKLKAENLAFVYLSANSSQKVLEEAKATEPYGFLVKPFREKDLIVSLEIACYRHKHSLESKLRREDLLQKQLNEFKKESSDARQKLLKTARAMQSYVPFDLLVCGLRPQREEQFDDTGYLRVGFDEYQYITEREFTTITGLKNPALASTAQRSDRLNGPEIYNGAKTTDIQVMPLQKLLFDRFKVASFLIFPVMLSGGSMVHYFFYSRQREVYTKNHLDLLNRLKTSLSEIAQDIISDVPVQGAIGQQQPAAPAQTKLDPVFDSIIGKHPLLLAALDLATQVAPFNTSVLILGESGTGKEKIAQAVHTLSTRKSGPYIKVNCATIPATLVESELFGHEKGAFTGATEKRKGRFEQADGGTIFLDEIGELPLELQAKLLRVLQEREIEPVGCSVPRKINVRFVTATNRNLEKEVAEGRFRLDLYYRLNVFPITLPTLRERKSDIAALTLFFANKFCNEFGKPFTGVSQSMVEEMYAYSWPGNIRELENVLEQSVILNDGRSRLDLKRSLMAGGTENFSKANADTFEDVKHIQRETEKAYIISVLKKTEGRIRGFNGAAELLQIKPTTLESKMSKLGIKKEDL